MLGTPQTTKYHFDVVGDRYFVAITVPHGNPGELLQNIFHNHLWFRQEDPFFLFLLLTKYSKYWTKSQIKRKDGLQTSSIWQGHVAVQFRERRCHNSINSHWGVLLWLHVTSNTFLIFFCFLAWGHPHRRFVTPFFSHCGVLKHVFYIMPQPCILGISEPPKEKEMPPHSWRIVAHIMCIWENLHSTGHQEGGWQVVRCVKRSNWNHLNKSF